MITLKPLSKLNELAAFFGMSRIEYLKALIAREHRQLTQQIQITDRPGLYTNSANSNYMK